MQSQGSAPPPPPPPPPPPTAPTGGGAPQGFLGEINNPKELKKVSFAHLCRKRNYIFPEILCFFYPVQVGNIEKPEPVADGRSALLRQIQAGMVFTF